MATQQREAVKPVSIGLRPTMARRILAVARQRGQSRSAFIRELVVKELGGDHDRQSTPGPDKT